MVEVLIVGVVKLRPVDNDEPPVRAANHCAVCPEGNETLNTTSPAPHLPPPSETGAAGVALMTASTGTLADTHPVVVFLDDAK